MVYLKYLSCLLRKMFQFILFAWSYSIVFALTDDSNFGTVEYKKKFKDDVREPRFSVFNIILGSKAYYFFSWDKNKKFDLLITKSLRYHDKFILPDEKINGITSRYIEHLYSGITNDDILNEKEFLVYHIQNQGKRIDTSNEKINLYATIILTVFPVLMAIIDFKQIFSLNIFWKIVTGYIAYSVINILKYIYDAIKIQSVNRSNFSELRSSAVKNITLNKLYQYDWQFLKRKADLFVSYVKNLQYWIAILFLLSIFLVTHITVKNFINNTPIKQNNQFQQIINVSIDEINNPYSSSAIAITKLNLDIQQKKVNEIIVISLNGNITENFIYKLRCTYKNLTLKFIQDKTLDKNTIKIIEED